MAPLSLAARAAGPCGRASRSGPSWSSCCRWPAIARTRRLRQERIDRDLPDFLDVLAVTVTAGVGFRSALATVSERFGGPAGRGDRAHPQPGPQRRLACATASSGCAQRNDSEPLSLVRHRVPAVRGARRARWPRRSTGSPQDMRRDSAQRQRQRAARVAPRVTLVTSLVLVPGALAILIVGFVLGIDLDFGALFGGDVTAMLGSPRPARLARGSRAARRRATVGEHALVRIAFLVRLIALTVRRARARPRRAGPRRRRRSSCALVVTSHLGLQRPGVRAARGPPPGLRPARRGARVSAVPLAGRGGRPPDPGRRQLGPADRGAVRAAHEPPRWPSCCARRTPSRGRRGRPADALERFTFPVVLALGRGHGPRVPPDLPEQRRAVEAEGAAARAAAAAAAGAAAPGARPARHGGQVRPGRRAHRRRPARLVRPRPGRGRARCTRVAVADGAREAVLAARNLLTSLRLDDPERPLHEVLEELAYRWEADRGLPWTATWSRWASSTPDQRHELVCAMSTRRWRTWPATRPAPGSCCGWRTPATGWRPTSSTTAPASRPTARTEAVADGPLRAHRHARAPGSAGGTAARARVRAGLAARRSTCTCAYRVDDGLDRSHRGGRRMSVASTDGSGSTDEATRPGTEAAGRVSVLVVDDNPVVRSGLLALLELDHRLRGGGRGQRRRAGRGHGPRAAPGRHPARRADAPARRHQRGRRAVRAHARCS